jgi:hypothetical protein
MIAAGAARTGVRTHPPPRALRRKQLAVSIHFRDWPDWRDAFRVLLAQSRVRHITRVGISAGRPDWTFYRSTHDTNSWSDIQRANSDDLVEVATQELAERGICATAMLDVFAPRYLQRQPQCAAADMRGRRSAKIVCSTALAEGEYGRILADAFEALAASTSADSLAVTNLCFEWHCFCRLCFVRFREHAWCSDWPRLANGAIDLRNPAIGKWRSRQVAGVVSRLGRAAHAHGKRLLVEVKLSRDDLDDNSRENGQDYALLRPHVDELVATESFGLEGIAPVQASVSARYLCKELGADNYWHCVGLWHRDVHALDAEQMRVGLLSALHGGARRLWITPSHYLSPLHWQRLDELMRREDVAAQLVD